MARGKSYIVSPGSQRLPLTGAHKIGPADPRERVDVTILLYGRARIERILDPQVFTRPIRQRTLLSRNEFEGRYGADPKSITLLQAFARENKLAVKEVSAARRTVILSGTVASMSAAFHVYLEEYEHAGVRFRGRIGSISIPSTLKDVVQGVFGLDNRPQANPHFRGLHKQADKADHMETVSYTPPQIAALYDFPSNVDGSGECIAFIELGGEVSLADLNTYWKRLKLTTTPKVTTVFVNGYRCDQAGHSTGPDGTVMSDIEVAGSIAPGAKIIVYFAENTDAGFLNAISTAVHDSTNRPSVISISWGAPECSWTRQATIAIHQALEVAASFGITVCVAVGDDGATDGILDGRAHVDFPATSPYALACGGTQLLSSRREIVVESVWNQLASGNGATGGGISDSDVFVLPAWQAGLSVPASANGGRRGRGVPDVAGNADPCTGYIVELSGRSHIIGGTGAVASLWSALIALINQTLGKAVGYINPFLALYASNPEGFREITLGNNGMYHAGPGWNACTGHGTPSGNKLAKLFVTARVHRERETGSKRPKLPKPTLVRPASLDRTFASNTDGAEPASEGITDITVKNALEATTNPQSDRYANVCFTRGRDHAVVPKTHSLEEGKRYHLRFDIGPLSPESAVENAMDYPFPTDLLPETDNGGHWLEVVVASEDFSYSQSRYNMFLPWSGPSWVCSCAANSKHLCNGAKRNPHLFIPLILSKALKTKPAPGNLSPSARDQSVLRTLRLGVYYQKNLIQSQLVVAELGPLPQLGEGYRSRVDYTLTPGFRDLVDLSPRSLNILTNRNADGNHRLVINGGQNDAITFNLSEGQMSGAIKNVRDALRAIHVDGEPPNLKNRYDRNNSKSKEDFVADLRRIAPIGWQLFAALFQDKPVHRRRIMSELRSNRAFIQISRVGGSNFYYPWAFLYDIALDQSLHVPCRLLNEWDHFTKMVDLGADCCPYEKEHATNTLCPFGFWGFRHDIELPPSMSERVLPQRITVTNRPARIMIGVSRDLDNQLTNSHLNAIEEQVIGGAIVARDSLAQIHEELDKPQLEVVYFYCHGGRQAHPYDQGSTPYLRVGKNESIFPSDITAWDAHWSTIPKHWEITSPLVFINGCHTAELTPEVLVNFVDAFVGVYAAGVIGTEVLVHQQLANEAALEFLKRFVTNQSVGRAISEMRMNFLRKGNLFGLAYTAYCSSDLVLVQ